MRSFSLLTGDLSVFSPSPVFVFFFFFPHYHPPFHPTRLLFLLPLSPPSSAIFSLLLLPFITPVHPPIDVFLRISRISCVLCFFSRTGRLPLRSASCARRSEFPFLSAPYFATSKGDAFCADIPTHPPFWTSCPAVFACFSLLVEPIGHIAPAKPRAARRANLLSRRFRLFLCLHRGS